MDRTTAHEIAEEFAGIINQDATITEYEDGSYKVELSSDVAVMVDSNGDCTYLRN